jgi:hypothetical protein
MVTKPQSTAPLLNRFSKPLSQSLPEDMSVAQKRVEDRLWALYGLLEALSDVELQTVARRESARSLATFLRRARQLVPRDRVSVAPTQ